MRAGHLLLLQSEDTVVSSWDSGAGSIDPPGGGRTEPVEVIGPGTHLAGSVRVASAARLSDFANLGDGLLELLDASLVDWGEAISIPLAPRLWLPRHALTLVAQRAAIEDGARNGYHVERVARRLTIVTPEVVVTGFAHLPEGAHMPAYLAPGDVPFLPMTELVVRATEEPGRDPVSYAFGLLNRARITALADAGGRDRFSPGRDAREADMVMAS